ncbi:aspartate/glutamate racemase family protein [Gordonia sp. SID5947]|uniref:maleate cis-trans isomerase family protein n=1 Tax=Gordonia sp. SID5947 TaxID=2690315 RepID=UPI001F0028A6|nr:aspartate/glutamate racemase family protein [Gordonia sp. SID5947]
MIVPSSNTAVEDATTRLLDDHDNVTFVSTRIRVQSISVDGNGAAFDVASMVESARLLADAKVDVIVWNGTAGSWLGTDHDQAICAAITDATGIPATTSTLAILAACRDSGITTLAAATPYTIDVVDRIIAEYAQHGIAVVSHAEWELSDNFAFAAASSDEIASLLIDAAEEGDAQAVALICTNVDGSVVAHDVEQKLGRPVIDSIAATLWWSLRIAGYTTEGAAADA